MEVDNNNEELDDDIETPLPQRSSRISNNVKSYEPSFDGKTYKNSSFTQVNGIYHIFLFSSMNQLSLNRGLKDFT